MGIIAIVSWLIIIGTCYISYRAFQSVNFFARMEFEIDKIRINKDYKRFVTSGFVHVNWQHLIFNMIALFFFSFRLEEYAGPIIFTIIYFASLIGGNLLAYIIHKDHGSFSSVGASGAVNGLIFASIAVFPGMSIFFLPAWLFGLIYVLYSVYGIRSNKDNIGHEAHLGGALIGMMIAILFRPSSVIDNPLPIALILLPTITFIIIIIKKPGLLLVDNMFFKRNYNYTQDDHYNMQKKSTQKEVDRILEKIHSKGMRSLSKHEREILEDFSKK